MLSADLIPDSPLETMATVSLMRSNAVRSVSFSGENEVFQKTSAADRLPSDAALLLSFTSIAEKEIRAMGSPARLWDDDEDLDGFPRLPSFGTSTSAKEFSETSFCSLKPQPKRGWLMKPRLSSPMMEESTSSAEEDSSDSSYNGEDESANTKEQAWKRLRAVSIDSPVPDTPKGRSSNVLGASAAANIVTPLTTPVVLRGSKLPMRKARLRQAQKAKRERRSSGASAGSKKSATTASVAAASEAAEDKKRSLKTVTVPKGKVVKRILRKKFSWKNFPELEAFLIANREEYLRHSALNYTVQQKQYNNRLTERLLELAAEHGYVFDDVEFSFVTVRDRIRCYFKSYVQSAKKRGVIIGYAARKAGLLTSDELEKSAGKEGTIQG